MKADAEKTRAYYRAVGPKALCSCNYCKNYYAQIRASYPAAAAYLDSIGVDIEKPLETSPLEPENGMLEYCACQYIVFGSCSDGCHHKIDGVGIQAAVSYPDTGIPEEHFVLELSPIRLKVIMPL